MTPLMVPAGATKSALRVSVGSSLVWSGGEAVRNTGPGAMPLSVNAPVTLVVAVAAAPCTLTTAPATGPAGDLLSVTVPEMVPGAAESTAIVSVTLVVTPPATPTSVSVELARPCLAATKDHAPTGTAVRVKAPVALVVAVVLAGKVLTVTPAIGARRASTTVPVMVPLSTAFAPPGPTGPAGPVLPLAPFTPLVPLVPLAPLAPLVPLMPSAPLQAARSRTHAAAVMAILVMILNPPVQADAGRSARASRSRPTHRVCQRRLARAPLGRGAGAEEVVTDR